MKNLITISSIKMMLSTVILSFLIIGCGEADKENEGNHLPDVKIFQNNKTVNIGTEVNLTSTAVDLDGDRLTYKWSFTSKPEGSKAVLTTNTTTKASFTADKKGRFIVQFTAKDVVNSIGKDSVIITAKEVGDVSNTCTSYVELSEGINANKTLEKGCYKVTRVIDIYNDALLTINAGATIIFANNAALRVGKDGALKAVGTVEEPILFSGKEKVAGYWEGIEFRGSNNPKNEISYAVIEYAGGLYESAGALLLSTGYSSDNRLKISNTTFRSNKYYGFSFQENSQIDKFENITSTKNGKTAGLVYMNLVGKLDSKSDFRGNLGADYITVNAGNVKNDATWQELTVPINMKIGLSIDDAILTLSAGVKIVFDSAVYLRTTSGALKAIGTKDKPITFTGKEKVGGYWKGIEIGSNSPQNILEHVIIEYAGSYYAALEINTHYGTTARVSVKNSIFRHNSNYAIYFDYHEDSRYNNDIASVNTFTDNEKGAIGKN